MPKNLFDYANESKSNCAKPTEVNEEFLKSKVNEYSNLSQGELMSKLLGEVQNSKNNGTFDINKIASSAEIMKQYLTPDQQGNLQNLLNKIK